MEDIYKILLKTQTVFYNIALCLANFSARFYTPTLHLHNVRESVKYKPDFTFKKLFHQNKNIKQV